MSTRPSPQAVEIRGVIYEIVNPSDFRIRQIKEFLDLSISNYSRERELAACIQGMIPDMPVSLASCREVGTTTGETETRVVFNLQSHELMDIVKAATVGFVEVLIADIEVELQQRPTQELRGQLTTLKGELKVAQEQMASSSLLEVSKAASDAVRKQSNRRKNADELKAQLGKASGPKAKATGFVATTSDHQMAAIQTPVVGLGADDEEQAAIDEFLASRRAGIQANTEES